MTIVVLDGFTANPGDLSWDKFENIADFIVYDRTSADLTVERAKDADIVLTNKTVLNKEVIEQLPNLKYIGVLATGYNVVDIESATKNGITVTNIPAYSTPAVAQHLFALILNFTNHIAEHCSAVKAGDWCKSEDFCFWNRSILELNGLTLGIVGFGQIGQEVAKIAKAFGMTILVYTRTKKSCNVEVEYVELSTLLKQSDMVSLHCPLTTETEKLVNQEFLAKMKKTALLFNTSRGGLIDEVALASVLNNGDIAGAGLDVLATEPPNTDNPLLSAKNCVITPHIAWAAKAARERLLTTAFNNVKAFIDNKPINVINN